MRRFAVTTAMWLCVVFGARSGTVLADDAKVSFLNDVAAILVQRCQGCHGTQQNESNYRLDSVVELQKLGDFGEPIVTPGSLDESLLWRLVNSQDDTERMPKDGEVIPERELALIRRWIEQGAVFDVPEPNVSLASQLPRPPYALPPESYAAPVPITAIAVDPSGNQIIVGGYREITLWNSGDGTLQARIPRMVERTTRIVVSPDRSLIAVTGGTPGVYGEARILNAADWTEVRLLGSSTDMILAAAFRPDGQEIAVGFPDQTIRIYEVATGVQRLKVEGHADWVTAIGWNAGGTRIVSGSRDKTAKIFDANSGEPVVTYSAHGVPVLDVAFSPDGEFVYSCGADRSIHYWKVETSKREAEIKTHTDAVNRVLIQDGFLYTASADRSAQQFKLEDRSVLQTYADHPDWVTAIAVDSARQRLITGCLSGHVCVADCKNGARVLEFRAAPGYDPSHKAQ